MTVSPSHLVFGNAGVLRLPVILRIILFKAISQYSLKREYWNTLNNYQMLKKMSKPLAMRQLNTDAPISLSSSMNRIQVFFLLMASQKFLDAFLMAIYVIHTRSHQPKRCSLLFDKYSYSLLFIQSPPFQRLKKATLEKYSLINVRNFIIDIYVEIVNRAF